MRRNWGFLKKRNSRGFVSYRAVLVNRDNDNFVLINFYGDDTSAMSTTTE